MRLSDEPEEAQIAVQGVDHCYREIRVENALTDKKGRKVGLKPGADVELIVEADPEGALQSPDLSPLSL